MIAHCRSLADVPHLLTCDAHIVLEDLRGYADLPLGVRVLLLGHRRAIHASVDNAWADATAATAARAGCASGSFVQLGAYYRAFPHLFSILVPISTESASKTSKTIFSIVH